MSLKTMSSSSQPRERAKAVGIEKLSDVELLAILISSGTHEHSALSLATDLLQKTGSIYGLSRLNLNTIKLKGLGEVKKITILAAIELGKRAYTKKNSEITVLKEAVDIYQYVYPKYIGLLQEHFCILLLDSNFHFVYEDYNEEGDIKNISVSLSWVMKVCANNPCPYVVIVHNHPSNNVNPSPSDDITTYSIMESIKLMKMKLYDHIIVGEDNYYSYRESDRLKNIDNVIDLKK